MKKRLLIVYALIFVMVISSACGKSAENTEEAASSGKATVTSSNSSVTVASGNGTTEAASVKEDPNRFKFSRTDYEEGDHVWYGRYEQDRRDSSSTMIFYQEQTYLLTRSSTDSVETLASPTILVSRL